MSIPTPSRSVIPASALRLWCKMGEQVGYSGVLNRLKVAMGRLRSVDEMFGISTSGRSIPT